MGRAFGAGVLLGACLLAAAPGRAQVPQPAPQPAPQSAPQSAPPAASPSATQPVTGFVSSYEITRIARSAGFDPLAPPMREGTIYVLRATDYRGILMRVVIDAHTGAIRDANRIVPGPGRYGQFYGAASLYDPADLAEPVMVPSPADMEPPPLRPLVPYRDAHCAAGNSAAAAAAAGSARLAQAARRRQSGRTGSPDRRSEERGDAGRRSRSQAADQFRSGHRGTAASTGRARRAEKISRHS